MSFDLIQSTFSHLSQRSVGERAFWVEKREGQLKTIFRIGTENGTFGQNQSGDWSGQLLKDKREKVFRDMEEYANRFKNESKKRVKPE